MVASADESSPEEVRMTDAQDAIEVVLWGFIESRGHIPDLVEAHGDLDASLATLRWMERAMELGFDPDAARDPASVLEGVDPSGRFELRQTSLTEVDVVGTGILFAEANALANAVAELLASVPADLEEPAVEEARNCLAAYDARWEIARQR
jgi:hypothetical protein